jgi:hypothetical protein
MKAATRTRRAIKLANVSTSYIERMINVQNHDFTRDEAWIFRNYLFTLRSTGQRFLYLLSLLYPSPQDFLLLPLPKSLHFFYFLLRPGLLVWRKARGAKPLWEG